jgi:xanthosine utilization system XapX-like protein
LVCVLHWFGQNSLPSVLLVGIVGIAILGFAYPIYKKVVQKNRAKVAPKILELSQQL